MAGAARGHGVVGRQEGVELPGAGAAVVEALVVTVDGEVLEVTVDEEVIEALVVAVAEVVVAEDSEAVEVASEAHDINYLCTRGATSVVFFMRRHSCERPQIAVRNKVRGVTLSGATA